MSWLTEGERPDLTIGYATIDTAHALFLRAIAPVSDAAGPPPPVVGTGELVTDALEHWPNEAGHAVVLRDRRAVAVMPRALLGATAVTEPAGAVPPVL
ncbi:hypothetical protein [Promicromonospora sp. NPDC059942]|uniref:hypothetical protein n=1 Tax=Promicromonospora sp. NPDC059942 TaxID=3347009 RepID=UPI0036513C0C